MRMDGVYSSKMKEPNPERQGWVRLGALWDWGFLTRAMHKK